MFEVFRKEIQWGGRKLTLETGKIARQADGAVLASYGDTVVLCTVVAAKEPKPDIDFFPLTVNYQEKAFAAGKIPGGFFKRETKPSENETLTSRLIDRPIRPLFHSSFRNETQVVCTVISHESDNNPDVVAMIGTSAALTLSGIPFMGPIAGVRVAYIDGQYVINPTVEQSASSMLDLVVAGTADSVLMVESEANELSEEVMLGAVIHGQKEMKPVIDMIISLAEAAAKEPWALVEQDNSALKARVKELAESGLREAYGITAKQERVSKISEVKKAVKAVLIEQEGLKAVDVNGQLKKLEADIVRTNILKTGNRIDGRTGKDIRKIVGEVDLLPRTHGSALFTRGETQALVVTTLGTTEDEQIIDNLDGDSRDSFLLHYNFPPYSVGEASPMRAPGRREIGHGRLAKRALAAIMPSKEMFPYTVRVVSEITESNGSSSMATVCGGSMSMMAAGVPLPRPCAGIAMGLIKEGSEFAVLSDIMGDEDHLGDMDFKVAGTEKGITALQMDIKIHGITEEIMKIALHQAHEGRIHILQQMAKAISEPRTSVNDYAPKMTSMVIPKDKIREVIGTGGKVIRELCELTGAKIDIEQDGTVRVAAADGMAVKDAIQRIKDIVAEPEVGMVYDAVVEECVEFGAFVQFLGSHKGLVHVSELAFERVENVTDVLKAGDKIKVKCIGFDRGKVRLSYRMVDQATGADAVLPEGFEPPRPREGRGDRDRGGRDRGGRDRGGRGDRGDRGRRRDRDDRGERGERGERPQRSEFNEEDNEGNRFEPADIQDDSAEGNFDEAPARRRKF